MSGFLYFFGKQASDDEQGSFCDTDSGIHYNNQSKEETLNHAAVVEEFGSHADIRGKDFADPSSVDDETRFNTTTLEGDQYGSESPAKYNPGR